MSQMRTDSEIDMQKGDEAVLIGGGAEIRLQTSTKRIEDILKMM